MLPFRPCYPEALYVLYCELRACFSDSFSPHLMNQKDACQLLHGANLNSVSILRYVLIGERCRGCNDVFSRKGSSSQTSAPSMLREDEILCLLFLHLVLQNFLFKKKTIVPKLGKHELVAEAALRDCIPKSLREFG